MKIATAQRKGKNILESRSVHLLACKTKVINNACRNITNNKPSALCMNRT